MCVQDHCISSASHVSSPTLTCSRCLCSFLGFLCSAQTCTTCTAALCQLSLPSQHLTAQLRTEKAMLHAIQRRLARDNLVMVPNARTAARLGSTEEQEHQESGAPE